MSEELRDLMVRTAESAPTVRIDPGLWRRARRARRRDRLLVPVAAAVVFLGVLGTAVQGRPLLGGAEVSPATGRPTPAMPSRVFAVPGHLDPTVDEDAWAQELDPTLAVGRAAVGLSVLGGTVAIVSALDGSYHLVDPPGLQHGLSFRFQDGVLALSPDGLRLAYTWNQARLASHDRVYAPSGVRIIDLATGDVSSHQVRKGYGVYSHGFSWSPNGRYLAYNTQIANRSQDRTGGSRNFFVERLDTTTGERLKVEGVPMTGSRPAVTDAGTVVVGSGTTMWTWRPDRGVSTVDLTESSQWRGSVTSIGALPGSETVFATAGLEYGRLFVGRPDDPGSFRRIGGGGQRLTVEGFVSSDTVAALEHLGTETTLWTADRSGRRSGAQVVLESIGDTHYSFATTLLRRPTRDFPEPDWPLSQEQVVVRGTLALVLVLGAVVVVVTLRRRRRQVPEQPTSDGPPRPSGL